MLYSLSLKHEIFKINLNFILLNPVNLRYLFNKFVTSACISPQYYVTDTAIQKEKGTSGIMCYVFIPFLSFRFLLNVYTNF